MCKLAGLAANEDSRGAAALGGGSGARIDARGAEELIVAVFTRYKLQLGRPRRLLEQTVRGTGCDSVGVEALGWWLSEPASLDQLE